MPKLLAANLPPPLQAILNGLRDSVSDFSGELHGVSNKEIMELLLVTQVTLRCFLGEEELRHWSALRCNLPSRPPPNPPPTAPNRLPTDSSQYFDAVKDIGLNSKGTTLFMTHSPSAIRWG